MVAIETASQQGDFGGIAVALASCKEEQGGSSAVFCVDVKLGVNYGWDWKAARSGCFDASIIS